MIIGKHEIHNMDVEDLVSLIVDTASVGRSKKPVARISYVSKIREKSFHEQNLIREHDEK